MQLLSNYIYVYLCSTYLVNGVHVVGYAWDCGNGGRVVGSAWIRILTDQTRDGICAGHVQNWVTQPYTWPAHILLVIMITCVGLRKRRARGSSCLHIVFAHPTGKRAAQACRRTNAVAVGPVNMMCKLTLTLTNANANFFSSPARSHTDRVARRNCMPQLRASSFRAPHKTQLHAATAASCKPQLRLSTYFGKTKQ